MKYLLDTNIVLHYLRESIIMDKVEATFNPFHPRHEAWICVVSFGELRSISIQNRWGEKKRNRLLEIVDELLPADVSAEDVIAAYGEIDSYSQGKLPGKSLGMSSRNMGKNDLWIASTASVLGAKLLTTDADFDHLKDIFLDVEKITA